MPSSNFAPSRRSFFVGAAAGAAAGGATAWGMGLATPRLTGASALLAGQAGIPLSRFRKPGDVHVWVQDAFDTAVGAGKILIGDIADVPLQLDGPIALASGVRYRGEGTIFQRMWGDWNTPFFATAGFRSQSYAQSIELTDLRLQALDPAYFGNLFLSRCNGLRLHFPRFLKLSANWTTCLFGDDIEIVCPWIDSYNATATAAVQSKYGATYADGLHAVKVSNYRVLGGYVVSQDDAIAFTRNPGGDGDLGGVASSISVLGTQVSSRSACLRLATQIEDGPVSPDACYEDVHIEIDVFLKDANAHAGIVIDDQRTNATAKHKRIFVGAKMRGRSSGSGHDIMTITGGPSSGIRNFADLTLAVVSAQPDDGSGAYGLITGIDDLLLDGCRNTPGSAKFGATACEISNVGRVRVKECDLAFRTTGDGMSISGYTDLAIRQSAIGGPGNSTDAFAALSLNPAAGANLLIDGLETNNAARSVIEGSRHTGDISARGLVQRSIADKGLPSDISLAVGGWATSILTPTARSGALTSASASIRYRMQGGGTEFTIVVSIAKNGTGSGSIDVPLPFTVANSFVAVRGVKDQGGSKLLYSVLYAGSTTLGILCEDGSYPGGDGTRLIMTGFCETAS